MSSSGSFETDDSYSYTDESIFEEDRLTKKKYYILSYPEIIPFSNQISQKCYFYEDITFEERLEKSFINIIPSSNLKITCDLSADFRAILSSYRKSIIHKRDMDLSNLPLLSASEKTLSCALYLLSTQIQKSSNVLSCAASLPFKDLGHNEGANYIIKHIVLLIDTLFANSKLHVTWDTSSNVYIPSEDDNLKQCSHDIIFTTAEGLEIGTGGVIPPNTSDNLVDVDRAQIAENMKKQLHCRLKSARHEKELFTFGIMIHGTKIELTTLNLTADGRYNYRNVFNCTLSTTVNDYAFIEDTIEIISSLILLAEDSLPEVDEFKSVFILDKFIHLVKPTVYMLRSDEE